MAGTLIAMSRVEHKEMRFLGSLIIPLCICWGASVSKINELTGGKFRFVISFLLRVWIVVELVTHAEKHSFVRFGDPDMYSMMAAGSPALLDYGNFSLP